MVEETKVENRSAVSEEPMPKVPAPSATEDEAVPEEPLKAESPQEKVEADERHIDKAEEKAEDADVKAAANEIVHKAKENMEGVEEANQYAEERDKPPTEPVAPPQKKPDMPDVPASGLETASAKLDAPPPKPDAPSSPEKEVVPSAAAGAFSTPLPMPAGSAANEPANVEANAVQKIGTKQLEAQAQAIQQNLLRQRQEAALVQARREAEMRAERQVAEVAAQRAAAQAHQAAQQAAHQAAHQAAQHTARQMAEQGFERVPPPRRAASARASQNFKQQAEYFDESPPDSPIDEPIRKPTPKAKPTPKPPSASKSNAQAWEDPPQKQLALKLGDVNKALNGKWLQLYWPDDGKWWPGQVLSVDPRKKSVTLLYETGEEENNLELADLIRKSEVAWMHEKDMPKEAPQAPPAARRAAKPGGMWRSDSFDDEDELPSASTSRGQAGFKRRQEEDEEDAWVPGQKRKAALKSRARYRDESEEESSYSESPPPSDQSSDWHSSEDDDKPRRKPKKKKKPMARSQPHPSHQQQAQPRQSHMPHQMQSGTGNIFGQGGIFDEGPPFGGAFGGGRSGGLDSLRLPGGQNNPAISRDPLQGGFPIERGWGVMTGAPNNPAGYRGPWPGQPQDLNQLFQSRQQMNNGSMGHLHIPQGPGGLDLSRLGANSAMMGAGGPNISQAPWRGPGMSTELMGDWASQLGSQAMFRLPQMAQQQLVQQQQQLHAQRLHQQQQSQHGQSESPSTRPSVNLGGGSKNMEGILSQGLTAAGKQVEVQQATGQWVKGTIMACLSRGSSGGSVMVCYDDGRQEQLLAAEEGRTFNIRML